MDPRNGEPESRALSLSIRKFLTRFGVDGAVGFAVASKIWQLLTGPITQFLLVVRFTPALQDYYYAFNNLLGLQVFVELGLHEV